MATVKALCGKAIAVTLLVACTTAVNAATVWTGPLVEFSKVAANDVNQAEYQDRITPLVWLTRGPSQGLFNIAQEASFQRFANISPVGTEWAFQGGPGNPESGVSAEDYASLDFRDWVSALGGPQQVKPNILDRPGVVHLIEEDIYFDILFLEWADPRGDTAVRYVRTSPIPVPAAAWLMASALGFLGFLKRRRTV